MLALVYGLFGLIIGSFLNVVILRHGARGLGGRSGCLRCGHELGYLDLVPVFSYLFLRGHCRYCHAKISIQYPLVEALTAISFALIAGTTLPFVLQLLCLPIISLLIMIAWYDGRHTIIPDVWAYSFAFFALIFGLVFSGNSLGTILAGIGAAAPFAFLWLVSNGQWMGLGDAKLALGIGFLLGPWDTYLALTLAFVLGALFFVPQVAVQAVEKRRGSATASYTMKSEVPFGPFLICACSIVWMLTLYHLDPAMALFVY